VFHQKLSCQDPEHKFGCDTVHTKFFHQNPLACPITNSHLSAISWMILCWCWWTSCWFMQQFQELCNLWVSLCVRQRQLLCDRSWTWHTIETPTYDSRFGPWRLVESLWGSV
jgi:hypothetical protein